MGGFKGVTDLLTNPKHGDGMLKHTTGLLKALYGIDILEAEVVLKWHALSPQEAEGAREEHMGLEIVYNEEDGEEKQSEEGAKNPDVLIREAAAPFIKWLQGGDEVQPVVPKEKEGAAPSPAEPPKVDVAAASKQPSSRCNIM